jgi:hypothetical protein
LNFHLQDHLVALTAIVLQSFLSIDFSVLLNVHCGKAVPAPPVNQRDADHDNKKRRRGCRGGKHVRTREAYNQSLLNKSQQPIEGCEDDPSHKRRKVTILAPETTVLSYPPENANSEPPHQRPPVEQPVNDPQRISVGDRLGRRLVLSCKRAGSTPEVHSQDLDMDGNGINSFLVFTRRQRYTLPLSPVLFMQWFLLYRRIACPLRTMNKYRFLA